MNAAILAIGTEVTSGQIKNSHASWISTQIDDFGVIPSHHVAVPDDHELILESLDYVTNNCEFIFVTGGLGPTRDDFTRNVIADWLDCELEFHDEIWTELQLRLSERNVNISPSHKNQCYFPERAKILHNSVGTAHGFYVESSGRHIWVLPGPVAELRAIWKDHVAPKLSALTNGKKFIVKKWRCVGMPESELADLTENVLEGSELLTGYRLDSPYVEVKVWVPLSTKADIEKKWLEKLDKTLSTWTISRDEEDIAKTFLNLTLKHAPLTLIDDVTQGLASERLMLLVREDNFGFEMKSLSSTVSDLKGISFDGHACTLKISAGDDARSWSVELKTPHLNQSAYLKFESKTKTNPDRLGRVKTELSLKQAVQWLSTK